MHRRTFLVSLGAFALAGCTDDGSSPAAPSATPSSAPATEPPSTPSPLPSPTASATASPSPAATATVTQQPAVLEPLGFPIDPATRTGKVTGDIGARVIRWGEGPATLDYSLFDQPSSDPDRANACGWNARVHVEYEGQPAVDWYLPPGTPVVATMDGTATLLVNTVANPFDVYGVSREPYIGNPNRTQAPISPFPGPGGGQGVFVRIENPRYRTDYAHFEIAQTLGAVPSDAFLPGYSATFDYSSVFAPLRDFRTATAVASWPVRRGQVIGFTGDSGYSEAPHLHYAIRPAGSENALCPTTEPGFEDKGWLFRA